MMGVLYKGKQHVGTKCMGKEQANIDNEQVGIDKEQVDMDREQVGMNWEQVDMDREHMHEE